MSVLSDALTIYTSPERTDILVEGKIEVIAGGRVAKANRSYRFQRDNIYN